MKSLLRAEEGCCGGCWGDMRNFVDQQLEVFLQSILLGLSVGVAHDLLRPFRLRLPRFAWALDSGYCLCAAAALFLFCLNRTQGQLRIYVLLGAAGGAALFFSLFSDLLRPIWDFWADTLAFLLHLLQIPWIWLKKFGNKIHQHLKNIFLLQKMLYNKRNCVSTRCYQIGKRRKPSGKGRNRKKPPADSAGSFRKAPSSAAARRAGVAAVPSSGSAGECPKPKDSALTAQVRSQQQSNDKLQEAIDGGGTKVRWRRSPAMSWVLWKSRATGVFTM